MAEILLFHHAQGLTPGVEAFADDLRAAGHTVHAPDLYAGRTFDDLDEGVAHAREIGFGTILEESTAIAEDLPNELVYIGFSMGAMSAQMLAQTRPGAIGAILIHGAIPLAEFGDGTWPDEVALQIHTMADDGWGDADVARELDAVIDQAEVYIYPGDVHLFTDRSLAAYDEAAAALVMQRVLALLATA